MAEKCKCPTCDDDCDDDELQYCDHCGHAGCDYCMPEGSTCRCPACQEEEDD